LITTDLSQDTGVGIGDREIARVLARKGVEVEIVMEDSQGKIVNSLLAGVCPFKASSTRWGVPHILLSSRRAARALDKIPGRLDVVHSQGPLALAQRFTEKHRKSAWVSTCNGTLKSLLSWISSFPVPLSHRTVYRIEASSTYHLMNWVYRSMAPHILAVSSHTRRELQEAGIPEERLSVVPNGVDPEGFAQPLSAPFAMDPFLEAFPEVEERLLFVGDITPRKGVHVLIEALSAVTSDHPQARLLLVGEATQTRYHRYLLSQIETSGLSGRVRFVGSVPHRLLPLYYHHCDLLSLPSFCEGAPLVIPEAMAFGKVVIATTECAAEEYLEPGTVVRPGDAEGLAERISTFLEDRGKRERIGRTNRRKVEERFTWERIGEAVLSIYRGILEDSDRGSSLDPFRHRQR
jgi:glycosyltransferase involved in cell wall biosynthesis